MAVIKFNHMKSGGQINSCVSLNVKIVFLHFAKEN